MSYTSSDSPESSQGPDPCYVNWGYTDPKAIDNVTYICPDLPKDWPRQCGMLRFWMGWQAWLSARGFNLNISPGSTGYLSDAIWCIPSHTTSASFPYAHRLQMGSPARPWDVTPDVRIAWAQDSAHRDVALKLTYTRSDEYRIYQTLLNLTDPASPADCCGVLRPVAILDTALSFSFIAMPRWGTTGGPLRFSSVGESIAFMRCTSKGLRLLHENRIVHRDISESNMLMNCYNLDSPYKAAYPSLDGGEVTPDLHYSIFDFDISYIFPRDAPSNACRRPSSESFDGAPPYHPRETMHGEHDYDPFAYDVGCLGNLYRVYFSTMVPMLPLLAPLFDRMTTHVVAERFTAAEAADFIELAISQVPTAALNGAISLRSEWECCDDPDTYWARTTPEFRARWAHLRTPGVPWTTTSLTQFIKLPMGSQLVCFVRDTLRI